MARYALTMPLTAEFARRWSESWYAAWNARPRPDLDAIMSHYAPRIEHSSPFIAVFNGNDDPSLRGIDAVRAYFGRAIEKSPTPEAGGVGGVGGPLRFNPMHVTTGHESVVLVYRRFSGEVAAEVFVFDEAGKVVRSVSHYGV